MGLGALDLPVHDPLHLVRIGPDELLAGHPAGMLGRRVPLKLMRDEITRCPQPWIGQPHFSHGSPGSW
jgi:hypothetical protein